MPNFDTEYTKPNPDTEHDTEHTNFLGIPVHGVIVRGNVPKDQRPLEDLAPLLQALLDDDTIVEFGWSQYTPYFNDGEPCVFGANGLWVRTVTDMAGSEEEEDEGVSERLGVEYGHPSLGEMNWEWRGAPGLRERVFVGYEGPDQARLERCLALNKAIESGNFDKVLLDVFGDHAEITVSRSGIQVEFYYHD